MTKILVTGATGCSCKGILHYLLSHGYTDLSGLVRKIPEDSFADVEYIVGDITNKDALSKLFKENQFESVWHLAGAVHPHTKKELFHKINVKGTQNVLESAIESGVKSFLFTSSIAVYGKIEETPINEEHRIKPLGNYAQSKVEAENIVKTLSEDVGIKGGIVRLPVVLGKDDRHFYPIVGKLVNANIFPIMGNPNHNFSIIHPYDIGRALETILNANMSKIESFNAISCDVSLKKLIMDIEMHLKGKNRFKYYLPYPLVYFGAWMLEMFTHIFTPRKDPVFNREYAQIIG
ncbi:MAG: NAD(P)-dependent oxidoreductase, partial [Candidatus Heimdallarchaeota archaeon]|nr:NAD(P)-dependent oxidoreductase [Candidatus Heimdallarchaeota archaeon]MCK4254188.1 NAD(P)-dependent oxidoreductase [Candidatus Heimdallarchaeota archaeon]